MSQEGFHWAALQVPVGGSVSRPPGHELRADLSHTGLNRARLFHWAAMQASAVRSFSGHHGGHYPALGFDELAHPGIAVQAGLQLPDIDAWIAEQVCLLSGPAGLGWWQGEQKHCLGAAQMMAWQERLWQCAGKGPDEILAEQTRVSQTPGVMA